MHSTLTGDDPLHACFIYKGDDGLYQAAKVAKAKGHNVIAVEGLHKKAVRRVVDLD